MSINASSRPDEIPPPVRRSRSSTKRGVSVGDQYLGEAFGEIWNEGPVRRRVILVQQAGGRQQHCAFADRTHHLRARRLRDQKIEIGSLEIVDDARQRVDVPAGNPDRVIARASAKLLVTSKQKPLLRNCFMPLCSAS